MRNIRQNLFSIGKLVDRYGVAAESLRNWERAGLIPPAHRTPGGHRRYTREHVIALDRLLCVRAELREEFEPHAAAGAPADEYSLQT